MFRVHVAPFVIVCEDVYGAPPLSETPSLHESVHDTSVCHEPPPTVSVGPVVGGGDGDAGSAAALYSAAASDVYKRQMLFAVSVKDWP